MQQLIQGISDFLVETFQRFFTTRSSKYFRIWQIILLLLIISARLPDALHLLKIELPEIWGERAKTILTWCASSGLFFATLTSQAKLKVVGDRVIKEGTDSDKLPITGKNEERVAENLLIESKLKTTNNTI